MKTRTILTVALIAFVLISLPIYKFMVDDWINRNQKQSLAANKVAQLRADLDTPSGVTILKESMYFQPLTYFGDCYGAGAKIIYGTNRSVEDIRKEYAEVLLENSWRPGFSYEGYSEYDKVPGNSLTLHTLDVDNPSEQDFSTIYSVSIDYGTCPTG